MRGLGTVVTAACALVAACGGGGDAGAPSSAPGTVAVASLAPTTALRTTTSTSTTTSTTTTTTTTLAPTTTLPPLPVPLAPPPEDGTTEPRVEIGQLEIPAIGLNRTIFEGIRLSTLDNGPGHWPGTAMPGDLGNVVLAGHRVSKNRDFNRLDRLVPGDEVIMSTPAGRHVYRVTGTEIVTPDAMWIVEQTHARTATLFACHPPGSVRERIVVHLELSA
jgi:sortase A